MERRYPDDSMREAILAAQDCERACRRCAAASLRDGDVDRLRGCIEIALDCAEMCGFTAGAMTRGARHSAAIAEICVVVCDACAEECGMHERLPHCRPCAEACSRCADACRAMCEVAA